MGPVVARIEGREIPGAGAQLGALQILALELDVDLAPGAILAPVRRQVAETVARRDLALDLLVDLVELLDARGKNACPPVTWAIRCSCVCPCVRALPGWFSR